MPLYGLSVLEIVSFALKVLATVSGGILGWYITPPVVRVLVRIALHKPAPGPLVTVSRVMGALIVGAIIWAIWSFGFGDGWGFGPGLGSGAGLGPGSGGKQAAVKNGESKETTDKAKSSKNAEVPLPETLSIQMRGGAGVEKQFYLVQNQPMTLDEVRQVLEKQRDHLKTVEIVIDENSVPERHAAVLSLRRLAHSQGFAVQTKILEKFGGQK
jgi:hypothetical protein